MGDYEEMSLLLRRFSPLSGRLFCKRGHHEMEGNLQFYLTQQKLHDGHSWERKAEKPTEAETQTAQTRSEDAFMKKFGEEHILEMVENEQKLDLVKTIKKNRESAVPL